MDDHKPELLVGHDIQAFDLPVLEQFGPFKYTGKILDTKIAARCIFPDTKLDDWRSSITGKPWLVLPKALRGSHTLKAWGMRLGMLKGDREAQDFSQYSEEMVEYCMQDCRVTYELYKRCMQEKPSEEMLLLEHEFSKVIDQQRLNGFTLDIPATQELSQRLQIERHKLEEELKDLFPPRVVEYKTKVKQLVRTKTIIFNPGSGDQIAWNLSNKYGWEPEKFTDGGKPATDVEVLSELDYPEAKRLTEFKLLDKKIGQIAEGDYAWLKLVHTDGKIHGGVNTNGTVTGRCSFVYPNMGNVPRVGNPYGKECRTCFVASPGWWLVGGDASSIQARILAHLMARYDKGEYIEVVTKGDIHECNRKAFGLDSRNKAKTGFYALIFGAGKKRFARSIGRTTAEAGDILRSFFRALPAFRLVQNDLGKIVTLRGCLQGLDKRRHPIRASHLGLSVILQSYEAVIMKTAHIQLVKSLESQGLVHGKDYKQVIHLYDEGQFDVPTKEIGEIVGKQFVQEIVNAGVKYNIKCPLSGEYKIGKNWAETH